MAAVYKAYQPAMDRYVALKVPSAHLLEDAQFRARFQREARTIAQLEHPHILPVHDFGEDDGVPYLVMRYVDAGTLRDLASRGPVPLDQAVRLVAEVAEALAYAHRQGVVHRDVKPANVLLDRDGTALLTDFGIAKLVEQTVQLTQGVLGTPSYMAPEQVTGKPVDERTDIYALGVTLYELLTGRRPFDGETPLAVAFKHVSDPLPPPRQVNPALPEAAERIMLRALAKDPADRYQRAGDLARDLRRLLLSLDQAADEATIAVKVGLADPQPGAPSDAATESRPRAADDEWRGRETDDAIRRADGKSARRRVPARVVAVASLVVVAVLGVLAIRPWPGPPVATPTALPSPIATATREPAPTTPTPPLASSTDARLVTSLGGVMATWTAAAHVTATPATPLPTNRTAAILGTAVAQLTAAPATSAPPGSVRGASTPTTAPVSATTNSALQELAGGWRILSERIFYDQGGGGAWSQGDTSQGLELAADGTWAVGASTGRWEIQPITANDWTTWGVKPYGPTRKIVVHGWNRGDATGPIEESAQDVAFIWIIYRVGPPTVGAPASVEIRFGRA